MYTGEGIRKSMSKGVPYTKACKTTAFLKIY